MSMWKYVDQWGTTPRGLPVTMGEGNTPMIRSTTIGPALGLKNLWFKFEGANPTGSYKDRFASAAVTYLKEGGRRGALGTSSGNTGAAMAAYCARAGIECCLAIVEGAPEGKLRQMRAYGAKLFRVKGLGVSPEVSTEVMMGLKGLAKELDLGHEVSAFAISPQGMAGVQTIGHEIADFFEEERFNIFSPAGGGGLTLAVARGVDNSGGHGRVHCVQPEGNDTIATALRDGSDAAVAVESTTQISGLQVGGVLDGTHVIETCRRQGGQGYSVADQQAWHWQKRLAQEEGVFCEPAGAVALAGVVQALERKELTLDENIVCLVTGSGFKDEKSLRLMTGEEGTPMVADFQEFTDEVKRGFA